jgi:hypothetical protein
MESVIPSGSEKINQPPRRRGEREPHAADVTRARRLLPLIKEGFGATPTEAALRMRSRLFKRAIVVHRPRSAVRAATHIRRRATVIAENPTSVHQTPDRIAEEHADGRFPRLAIRRGGLGVAATSDRPATRLGRKRGRVPKSSDRAVPTIKLCYLPEFGWPCFWSDAAFCCAALVLPDDTWADTVSVPLSMTATKTATRKHVLMYF